MTAFRPYRFPLPNLRTVVQGGEYALRIDNGLGEYLVHLGLAKPFIVYSEWSENISRNTQGAAKKPVVRSGYSNEQEDR